LGHAALSTGKDIHKHIGESRRIISANIGIPLIRMYLLCQADIWVAQTEWSSLASLNIKPEGYVLLLTACAARSSEGLALGKSIFSHLSRQPDWNLNPILFSAVINMLVRCGDSSFASSVFAQKPPHNAQDLAHTSAYLLRVMLQVIGSSRSRCTRSSHTLDCKPTCEYICRYVHALLTFGNGTETLARVSRHGV